MLKTTTHLSPEIFRAYDIRGIVGETLTPESVYEIGRAIGSEAQARNEKSICIGRDGRLSGPTLLTALAKGILATGCDVIDLGALPTPVLYFATNVLPAHSGVILTGSHNPPNYNGLKIVIAGHTLVGDEITALYHRIAQQDFATGQGKLQTQEMINSYINYICDQVKLARRLKVVIDCGNGITGAVAPTLFKKLGCDVIELFSEVDGNFPNHHPDPGEPENLHDIIAAVHKEKADLGLAFDGDGDRCGVVTNQGEIIWPDRQLMLFIKDILPRYQGAKIIYDVKSTQHLARVIKENGGEPLMWKTGHSLIKGKLKEVGAPIAGEMSGHIFFKDGWFGFDDGMYTGVRLLEILAKSADTLSAIFKTFPDSVNTPELKLSIAEAEKFSFMEKIIAQAKFPGAQISTIDGLRADFPEGFGLIRPSNTTPYLILRFESATKAGLQTIQEMFRKELLKLNPALKLPF